MHAPNGQRAIFAALIYGMLAFTPAVPSFSAALAEESPIADAPTDAAPTEDAPSDDTPTDGAPSEAAAITMPVRTFDELKAALEDPIVAHVVVVGDIVCDESLTVNRDVVIDLLGNSVAFDRRVKFGMIVQSGSVEIKNGSISASSPLHESRVLDVRSGMVTLGPGSHVHALFGPVWLSGDAALVVDGGKISTEPHSPYPCIMAFESSSITVLSGELEPSTGFYSILGFDEVTIAIKGGTFKEGDDLYELDNVEKNLVEGYRSVREMRDGAPQYVVKGDLAGPLTEVTLSPSSFAYDGAEKTPAVTVMFDGEDISDQVAVTYENNREPGTATATIRSKASSDKFTGEKTVEFLITGSPTGPSTVGTGDTPTGTPGTTGDTGETDTGAAGAGTAGGADTATSGTAESVRTGMHTLDLTHEGTARKPSVIVVREGDGSVASDGNAASQGNNAVGYGNDANAGIATTTAATSGSGTITSQTASATRTSATTPATSGTASTAGSTAATQRSAATPNTADATLGGGIPALAGAILGCLGAARKQRRR